MADHRKTFSDINKYQSRIMMLTFLPTVVICIAVSILLYFFYKDMINVIVYNSEAPTLEFINQWGGVALAIVWGLFATILVWGYAVSKHLVGPFQRIIRELDEVVEGKRDRIITARKDDTLANELLKRINVLIEHYLTKK